MDANSGRTLLFKFACPACRAELQSLSQDEQRCPAEGTIYRRQGRIWRLLTAERGAHFEPFLRDYEATRRAEGRGSKDPAYFESLPFVDLSGRFEAEWAMRATSFAALIERVIRPLEKDGRALKILDLGAGNGWLSNRLSERGHHLAAVDLLTNAWDGLGALIYYAMTFTPVQAEFERLPFTEEQAHLAIFNASFHYATDYASTLREAFRVVKGDGKVVILDSPVYRRAESGEEMAQEHQVQFGGLVGFPFDTLPSRNYLTEDEIRHLGTELGIYWKIVKPFYGLRWALKPWLARLQRQREPARLTILVGERSG